MTIDYSILAIPKGTPRIVDRIQKKRDLAAMERECRAAVQKRDKWRRVVLGCKEASAHMHYITYGRRVGKWRSQMKLLKFGL